MRMGSLVVDWPDDADGDVFRRLAESDFDFSKPHTVDYNVDFNSWPPQQPAIDLLASIYGAIEISEPGEFGAGYVLFQIHAPVTYEYVTTVQRNVSIAMAPYGGICESWGVMSE